MTQPLHQLFRLLMAIASGSIYFFVVVTPIRAQTINPKLTGVISFDDLLKRKIVRSVAWTNPDGSPEHLTFTEMAIPFDSAMIELTSGFNRRNYHRDGPWLEPRMIVFHSMDLGDLRACLEESSFLHNVMPRTWGRLPAAGELPNGAQFIVDRDGTVFCLSPPIGPGGVASYTPDSHRWYIKRHADGNPVSLGIENVTARNGDLTDLTPAQVEANAALARLLIWMENGRIDHLISHHQLMDDRFLENMLAYYHLRYPGKANRTTGRTDVGNTRLSEIVSHVNRSGYRLSSHFD